MLNPVLRIHKTAWLLILLSAGLQVLIFPLPDLYVLCWIAMAPLLIGLLRARRPNTLQLLKRSCALWPRTAAPSSLQTTVSRNHD